MAYGKKTGGRNFKAGNPGGPGRPALPGDVKAARALNKVEFTRIINKYLHCTPQDLNAALNDPSTPVIEGIVCKILIECGLKGDTIRLAFLIERILGKVKDEVEVSLPKPTIIKRKDGTEVEMGARIEEESVDD